MAIRTPPNISSPVLLSLFNASIARGWSYKVIADRAGVGRSTVASWWAGDRSPGIENVDKWARALGGFIVLSLPYELPTRMPKEREPSAVWAREEKAKIGYAGRGR